MINKENIEDIIQEYINPALAKHKGFVMLSEVEDKNVYLEFYGNCSSCSESLNSTLIKIEMLIQDLCSDNEIKVINIGSLC